MTEAKTGQRNLSKQHELIEFLGDKNLFSPKGIQFLAKRSLGTQYKGILDVVLNHYQKGTLQKIIPKALLTKIKKAFNYEKDIPDVALVIISTGRRAVHGAKGWDEGGVSLLTTPNLPNNFDKENEKTQERITKMLELRLQQKEIVEELMEVLTPHIPVPEPVKEVIKEIPPPPVQKTAEVLEFKSKKKPAKEPAVKKTPLKRKVTKPTETSNEV
jgi:hypothetical protein